MVSVSWQVCSTCSAALMATSLGPVLSTVARAAAARLHASPVVASSSIGPGGTGTLARRGNSGGWEWESRW